MAGNLLAGSPKFCKGAVVDPGADPIEPEIERMHQKVRAGAQFFQTQPIFDVGILARFVEKAGDVGVPVIGGVFLLKSAKMAVYLNENVPGVNVPNHLVREMEEARDPMQTSILIASRIINQMKGICRGVHVMTVHWEDKVPMVLEAADLVL